MILGKMSNVVAEEYASSLSDLTVNSKPLINMLTMLAEENHDHAAAIVQAVEKHLQKVPSDIKLPVLYLIDSIVKNVGRSYVTLFTQNIVSTFCSCFEKVDERTRAQMFKLRQTWNEVFPAKKLYAVDVRVSSIDPAWPITAPPPTSIHVNPKFFAKPLVPPPAAAPASVAMPPQQMAAAEPDAQTVSEIQMRDQLLRKQKELIELQQRKLTLELMQTKAKLEEQQKQLDRQTGIVQATQQLLQNQPVLQASSETAAQILAVQKIIEAATLQQLPAASKAMLASRPTPPTIQSPPIKTDSAASIRPRVASPPRTSVRPRDPRLAARNLQSVVPQEEQPTSVDSVKLLESSKSKLPITNNLGCDNKSNVPNKEQRGVTKPRMITAKVRNGSKLSPPSATVDKGPGIGKPKVPIPSLPSRPLQMKRIPRLKDAPKIIKIDLTCTSPKKVVEVQEKVSSSSKKTSPSKVGNPTKKSPTSISKDKAISRSKSGDNKAASKVDSPRRKSGDSKGSLVEKRGKSRDRDRSKYDLESDGESPSPPPPPLISDGKKPEERGKFRDVKISAKGRNYVRRNRRDESRSRSPVKSDVDLRLSGPPEKQQKLMPTGELPKKQTLDGIALDAAKDIDLRQLPVARTSSPSKKRASTDRELRDQPPTKKSKSEMFDVLFGNEDVDLRRLASVPAVSQPSAQPSPPPPPIISHPSPSSSPTPLSPRRGSLSPKSDGKKSSKGKSSDDHGKGNGEVHPRDWAKFKGPKSPVASPYRDRRGMKTAQGKLDRLGRPLLFHRLSSDGRSDRRRYPSVSEDTDMRMYLNEDSIDDADGNIDTIVAQAEEQVKNGQLTFAQYNTLIKQVIQLNEAKKIREAQRRDESWEQRSSRSHRSDLSPLSDDGSLGRGPSFSPCSDSGDQRPRVSDVDDRYSHHAGRGGRPGNWPWVRQPQPWIHGPPGVRPMFPRPPGPDGGARWRPPHQPFIGRMPFDGHRPRFDQFHGGRVDPFEPQPPPPSAPGPQDLPSADAVVLDHMSHDSMRTINIDGVPREIRYYGDTAVTMVAWDDPREVMFQRGTRRVMFDDRESFLCAFNDVYKEFVIDGEPHKIRFGAPTRELYIDGKWYECYFGGPPITVEVGGKVRTVKLEGPPPQVKLGFTKRLDLCAGKINLIVDAMNMVPVFLDAKPQRFDIENKPHILRFINALTTVLINGRPFDVEFGGLPKPIIVNNKKHFIRFSVLPRGIRPGYVSICNMEGGRLPTPPPQTVETENGDGSDKVATEASMPDYDEQGDRQSFEPDTPTDSSSILAQYADEEVMPLTGVYINKNRVGGQVPLDMLTSLMPSALAPSSGFGYQVEPESASQDGLSAVPKPTEASTTPSVSAEPVTFLPPSINVDELFQKLVATGIVPTAKGEALVVEEQKREEPRIVRHVDLKAPETLRVRQPGLIAILYSGIQCSSCGVRFPPEETVKYSQHLDWHFRQNRRERDNTRKAQSRKWYYDVSDWIQFEEIEDLEHRAQSWFDVQLEATSGVEDAEPVSIPSVPVGDTGQDPICEMCHDKFEQFYNEESEEWHLKLAVRVDGKIYHPLCYEDFQASLLEETVIEEKDDKEIGKEVEVEAPSIPEEVTKVTDADKLVEEIEVAKVKDEILEDSVIKEEVVEKMDEEKENEDDDAEIKIERESEPMELPSEDLTGVEDTEVAGSSEAELVVKTLLDDILETTQLQLFGPRTVKLEPTDKETDEAAQAVVVNSEVTSVVQQVADTTHVTVVSSIDGNVQFEDKLQSVVTSTSSKIKINITKTIPARESHSDVGVELSPVEDTETLSELIPLDRIPGETDSEPPPPGVETVPVCAKLKPKLVGRTLTVLPPVKKGSDLSGLCSIM